MNKKHFAFLISLLLCLFLIGCTNDESASTSSSEPSSSSSSSTEYGVLKGTVTDEQGKPVKEAAIEPIPQFSVNLPEIGKVTDEKGQFEWSLPIGKYKIKVEREGYQSQTKEIELTKKGGKLDFVLKKAP